MPLNPGQLPEAALFYELDIRSGCAEAFEEFEPQTLCYRRPCALRLLVRPSRPMVLRYPGGETPEKLSKKNNTFQQLL